MKPRNLSRATLIALIVTAVLASGLFVSSAQLGVTTGTLNTGGPASLPKEFDVRGPDGVPKGTALRAPLPSQLAALAALEHSVGSKLSVQYNGLTATPRHLLSRGGYLSAPSPAVPEQIARDFIGQHRALFRFDDADLRGLRLKSRARLPEGMTVLLFEQTAGGLPVYNAGVLVNVNRAGRIISVGGESFPRPAVTNAAPVTTGEPLAAAFAVTPEQAVTNAAAELGVAGFAPRRAGSAQVPLTFGDLPRRYEAAPKFRGAPFTDDIVVTKTVLPLGDQARLAYRFSLTTPQFYGITWENVVDAQTGKVLRRISLTAFQAGGGHGAGRRGTFRPDVQDLVESFSTAPAAAQGKVTDTAPTTLSGYRGFGRSTARGNAPTYGNETAGGGERLNGRGFKFSQVDRRHENPLIYNTGFGQVLRGFPDALNPTPASPFGWFYLPTNTGGSEVTTADGVRTTTRDHGYAISAEAKARNAVNAANSPAGDGSQPFAADLTPLPSAVNLGDGRSLSAVFQSRYTEGNNVVVSDDIANDDETTHGVKGYAPGRQFNAPYFDYLNSYEYGSTNGINPTSHPDVFPGTTTLFYYTNLIHDYMYSIGFTEATWNFQQDNFGRGGEGGDGLVAQVQDGSGTNNANFTTRAEGTEPRMQMYLFTEDVFRRSDGDFDFDVVAHEYYHGVSNRSAGKGSTGCLGVAFFGESGGMGEGWGDTLAASLTDDDVVVEYATGEYDRGIRSVPMTNFRHSYGAIDGRKLNRRDRAAPDPANPPGVGVAVPPVVPAFQVHFVGTIWSAMTWDLRELLIMKQKVGGQFPGVFFDGMRRSGGGSPFYIGERLVQSVDDKHPIDYRESFGTHALVQPTPAPVGTVSTAVLPVVVPVFKAEDHIQRPRLVADEIAARGGRRDGPLATAVSRAARLADTLVLRGIQLAPCNPSFVDMRDAILLADKELTGGENRAVIWRAFASHGLGAAAASSHSGAAVNDPATSMVPVVVEDFTVPAGVAACEQQGPLAAPSFTLANATANAVTVQISPLSGAARYVVSRAERAEGPYQIVAEMAATNVADNNNGTGLDLGKTYFYQVRASRDAEFNCVSPSDTGEVEVTVGEEIVPSPLFAGVERVDDPRDGGRLIVSWNPATSPNPTAEIVYDVFRVDTVAQGDGTAAASFAPAEARRVATVTGTSYHDRGLELGNVYYYVVQARDTNNGTKDTNNAGNSVTRFNAPTVAALTSTPVFARETFETSAANSRFTLALTESGGNPNTGLPLFQRVTGGQFGDLGSAGKMYAPDLSPGHEQGLPDPEETKHGGGSDFSAVVGGAAGLALTPTSILEFDHSFNQEAGFDGGVLEISVGDPTFNGSTPFTNNTTVYDLGNFIVEGGYNAALDGTLEDLARLSPLQGRLAYTGTKQPHHVRVALHDFAPGETYNPRGLPVYVRFRMTSDAASANGADQGWYIDNVAINNLACRINVAAAAAGATAAGSSVYPSWDFNAASAIDGDRTGTNWGAGGGWNDATRASYPDWLEVNFGGGRTIDEVRVYTLQDNYQSGQEPTAATTANADGLIDFDVQAWDGSAWVTVPGGAVRGNDRALRSVTFPAVTTTKVRVLVLNARNNFSRIVEVEAMGCGG